MCASKFVCVHFLLSCRCFWFSQHFIYLPICEPVWSVNNIGFFPQFKSLKANINAWTSKQLVDRLICKGISQVYWFNLLSVDTVFVLSIYLYSSVKKVRVHVFVCESDLTTLVMVSVCISTSQKICDTFKITHMSFFHIWNVRSQKRLIVSQFWLRLTYNCNRSH